MSSMLLEHKNGSAPAVEPWLQLTARQFFSGINWDDQTHEVQELNLSVSSENPGSLSLLLKVNQFFSAINWDGGVASPSPSPTTSSEPEQTDWARSFTLDNFSDLF